jgi:hypothetical protein
MVDVLGLDSITVFLSGEKLYEINCVHLVDREAFVGTDERAAQSAKTGAKKHGREVLDLALNAMAGSTSPGAQYHVVGHEGCEPRSFEDIFKSAYCYLLHQQGTSDLLRLGPSSAEAALYLTQAGTTSTRKQGSKKSASKPAVPV